MVQTAQGADRHIWASNLGRIIFCINEIDMLFGRMRSRLFHIPASRIWLEKNFSERFKTIRELSQNMPDSPLRCDLEDLLARTCSLNEIRNHITHGSIGQVSPADDRSRSSSFEMIFHDKGVCKTLALAQLTAELGKAIRLSDDYARFISRYEIQSE